MSKKSVLRWLQEELSRPGQAKVGANILYDLEFLAVAGVNVAGKIYDVQYAEPLIDENKLSYSLDSIAKTHLGESKVDDAMYKWIKMAYGKGAGGGDIWRTPTSLVGPYAEGDVDLPLRIFEKQKVLLEKDGLTDLFDMECSLIPMLLAMRLQGVRVDVEKAHRIGGSLEKMIAERQRMLNTQAGFSVNVNSADELAKLFDKNGISYPKTPKTGKPSFVKGWLEAQSFQSPTIALILEIRKFQTILGTFIRGYILEKNINGRIYCNFHPLRSDEGGTVSGRYSSSLPNLQNIPMRDRTMIMVDGMEMPLGKAIRSLFIPEDDCIWTKDDYSQVEFRLITHYGEGDAAEEARRQYNNDPTTDFHTLVSKMCDIDRSSAKGINFGLAYNMGEDKLAASLNITIEHARELFTQYHQRMPFVKGLQEATSRIASTRGYIKTFLGRRSRFDMWESRDWATNKSEAPLPEARAKKKWGKAIRRAWTYRAMNRLIQGTAADVMKKSMSEIWKSGVCDVIGAPHLTVHDELDWSVGRTKAHKEAHDEVLNIMQTSLKFKIPLICDTESGPSWGEVK
jgi:DNA polymerase I-like protein with 3'-5' exonuclease and polymerase domains